MENGVVDLAEVLARRGIPVKSEAPGVAARLEKRFGLGDKPSIARLIYREVEAWVEGDYDTRIAVVSRVVAQAVSARAPGRYFRATIRRVIAPPPKEVVW